MSIPINLLETFGISSTSEDISGYKNLAEGLFEQITALNSQVSTMKSLLVSAMGGPDVVSVHVDAGVVTIERL